MTMLLQGVFQHRDEITNGIFREVEETADEILKVCGDEKKDSAFNHGVDVSLDRSA